MIPVPRTLHIQENIPLAPLTTLGIGGNARYFVRAQNEDAVRGAVRFARDNGLQLFVLGGGSNVLVADNGFDGLVLRVAMRGVSAFVAGPDGVGEITAAAGEDWDKFVEHCVEHKLAGVECLSGIPGFVGGTPVQNVGAYGQEVSETITSVRCFDRDSSEFVVLTNADCGFSYRQSIFNSAERDRYIVTGVTFSLVKNGKAKAVYPELKDWLYRSIYARWACDSDPKGDPSPLFEQPWYVRYIVLQLRESKSMVIKAGDPNGKSAGSFFKNPIVEREKLEQLKDEYPEMPSFVFGDRSKIPAAWLIENAGFQKGFVKGNAGISTKHTLAIVNRGGASAAEVLALKEMIQQSVDKRFGIQLQPEPVFVGF